MNEVEFGQKIVRLSDGSTMLRVSRQNVFAQIVSVIALFFLIFEGGSGLSRALHFPYEPLVWIALLFSPLTTWRVVRFDRTSREVVVKEQYVYRLFSRVLKVIPFAEIQSIDRISQIKWLDFGLLYFLVARTRNESYMLIGTSDYTIHEKLTKEVQTLASPVASMPTSANTSSSIT